MKIKKFISDNWKYFLKYSIVGTSGTIIDVGGFALFITFTPINRFIAATITFIAAVINNYTWNKVWTFKDKSSDYKKQFIDFLIVSVGGLLLNLFFLWFFGYIIGLVLDLSVLPPWANTLAKIGASGAVLTYNFLANRFWTFKKAVDEQLGNK